MECIGSACLRVPRTPLGAAAPGPSLSVGWCCSAPLRNICAGAGGGDARSHAESAIGKYLDGNPHARSCFEEFEQHELKYCGEWAVFYHSYSFAALIYEAGLCGWARAAATGLASRLAGLESAQRPGGPDPHSASACARA